MPNKHRGNAEQRPQHRVPRLHEKRRRQRIAVPRDTPEVMCEAQPHRVHHDERSERKHAEQHVAAQSRRRIHQR